MSDVLANVVSLRGRIAGACQRANRTLDSVQLVAVSKLHPPSLIREAYRAGIRDFGENYAQELREKALQLSDLTDIRWHAIGPLQLNKAKYVAKLAYAFHALDREDLAPKLAEKRSGRPLRCYLEVNLGGESSKSGFDASRLEAAIASIREYSNLEVVGLMCLPPLGPDSESSRPFFRGLREMARKIGLPELSMGTTYDFEVAIEEGATLIRVGTALFGERPMATKSPAA